MEDKILRLTVAEGGAVAFVASSKHTVEKARQTHQASPVVTAALGRLLTACGMMGQMLDDSSDKLSILIKGDGPVGSLLVTGNHKGQVKGFANHPQVEVENKVRGKLDVASLIGKGSLTVIKDVGGKEPFAGTVELVSSEIAEDLAYYYVQSEQTMTAMALGVHIAEDYRVDAAGGYMIQLLPGANPDLARQLETQVLALGPISEAYRQGASPEDIADRLFKDLGYKIHSESPLEFYCSCSKDRLASVLVSLGKQELENIIAKDKGAEVLCQFCNQTYKFSEQELRDLLDNM